MKHWAEGEQKHCFALASFFIFSVKRHYFYEVADNSSFFPGIPLTGVKALLQTRR